MKRKQVRLNSENQPMFFERTDNNMPLKNTKLTSSLYPDTSNFAKEVIEEHMRVFTANIDLTEYPQPCLICAACQKGQSNNLINWTWFEQRGVQLFN